MESHKPNRTKEFVGRLAVVGIALMICLPATGLVIMGLTMVKADPDSASGIKLGILPLVGAIFLYLMAGAMILMTFIAGGDTPAGPPRGFNAMSRFFDGFWNVAGGLLAILRFWR